jgi:hypothetical protein
MGVCIVEILNACPILEDFAAKNISIHTGQMSMMKSVKAYLIWSKQIFVTCLLLMFI